MKLSMAWIFDHIDARYQDIDIPNLMNLFNQKVSEVEGFYASKIDLSTLFAAQVESEDSVFIPELSQSVEVPARLVQIGQHYLLRKHAKGYSWGTESDLGGEKDTHLPALQFDQEELNGAWRKAIPEQDYIIEIDNKSVTHRPDMWGHRGVAREIAALLELPLKPLDAFLTPLQIQEFEQEFPANAVHPFSARVVEQRYVNRFALAYFPEIQNGPSLPAMAARLCRISQRPIDLLVDLTNYVMLDIGQPMHAFDANVNSAKYFEVRLAHQHEKLTLLDDETIELTPKDIVITDGSKPISLAGVMGGKDTQIVAGTTSMVLESAHFDPTMVRETAARHKKRTEASARFEKNLDPNQNITAIERFVRLLQDAEVAYKVSGIASIGPKAQEPVLDIEHAYIEKKLGITVSSEQVLALLERLGFGVTLKQDPVVYNVHVPSFRCSKDIRIKEDILEEIGRSYGYGNITPTLPHKETKPSDVHAVYMIRRIKKLLAYGCAMHEVSNYSFYDEDFLRELNWQPHNTICVQSPVSENWKALVSSLIPGLLKNVAQNQAEHDRINFFEWGRVWHKEQDDIIERKQLAGICFDQKNAISYYDVQAIVAQIAHMLRLPISYKKVDNPLQPWSAPYQTAQIMYGDIAVGLISVLDKAFTRVLAGNAAIFVLDGNFLEQFYGVPVQFMAPSKYPAVQRDISIMVPLTVTVEQVMQAIQSSSKHITHVKLVDMFKKDDWHDLKSLTFNYTMQDRQKTLTSQEAEEIAAHAAQAVQALGAQIR